MKKLLLLGLCIIFCQACSQNVNSSISNTKWRLSEWPGKTLPTKVHATLNFDENNRIGGKSFCNSYGGNVLYDGNKVKFDQIFSTQMYCNEVSEAENRFLSDLKVVNQAKISGGKLQLLKDGNVMLIFVKGD